ncbi:hypothetical protein [Oharaeibacter diazotrophicus]|uniref:Hpr(Ser) kinase/phosphatase n=3 Tax=Oharaeibacter diazotrophicus TaxID=1920512 RepID=A0A4R6RNC8_9HYPH|nr:hypothetical protein [Oharaeibacter diazotrophicus]TDP87567.1 Hpr(Ser) kinase/phosphatase [Oharaeibacter diazotrophicus]BBE70488.1 hypothetical protein OHA_1_00051 [Pleomorphomonas sp. SM30]GLS77234.1 hypothetical protein GCM10007904_25710 [Oharaeibacter diazotrophicus]
MGLHRWADCTIRSGLPLPELAPAPAGAIPDVEVVLRTVPTAPTAAEMRPVWSGPDDFAFATQVARYRVRDGRHVVVEVPPEPDMAGVRLFLLGSAFAALAVQRGVFQLHAGAVDGPGGVAAFAADSGHGKSTLIAHLGERGHTILSDDTLPLQIPPDGPPLVLDTVRRLKLLPDAVAALGVDRTALAPVMAGHHKLAFLADRDAPPAAPPPLAALYLLGRAEPGAGPSIRRLRGVPAVEAVRRHAYRPRLAVASGRQRALAAAALAVATGVPVFRLLRPWDLARIDDTLALIARHRADPVDELHG